MNPKIKSIGFLIIFLTISLSGYAQLKTEIINPSKTWIENDAMFFSNRTLITRDDGSVTFKNQSTKQTNSLYFCTYDFAKDSIEINYKTINLSDKYPTGDIEHNIIYDFYKRQRIDRGIKNYYFIVGGYGKSFKKQVHSYMRRLKSHYGDTLFTKAAIIVFAWGTEGHAIRYYNALRASRRGAADFAIFQHMLDEFVSDTTFFQTHPNDLTIDILFSSMGNYLFKRYMEERKAQNIPFVKTYNRILFVGSVAQRNSFEKGKAFYNLNRMTDTVDVYVNKKDALLMMSSLLHLKGRMGNRGPKNEKDLPGYINVVHIEKILSKADLPGLGHDYLLTNPVL
ncbi:MAG: alpha/beta hydrolase, partial [Bacteroidota bacterium]